MTTNLDHEIKFKRLNNLKDPAANRTWLTNIINICRSRKVTELVSGTKEDRGLLVLLLQYRVFPDEDGVVPDGDEAVSYGTGDDDWSAALTAETETLLWGICYAALSDTMRETMSEKFDHELRGGGPPLPRVGPDAPLDRQQGDRRAGSRPDLLQQDQARGAAPPLPARVRRVRRAGRGAHLDRLQHRGPLHEGARAEEVPPVPRCGDEPPDRDAARLRGFGPRRWAGVDGGQG